MELIAENLSLKHKHTNCALENKIRKKTLSAK
ncbi:hypothetical protein T08_3968 [Trichinella sp. T8]|nr:hypothetical protein T08_3968 [Trichinella sp. T8]